jgi:hypothetical protein
MDVTPTAEIHTPPVNGPEAGIGVHNVDVHDCPNGCAPSEADTLCERIDLDVKVGAAPFTDVHLERTSSYPGSFVALLAPFATTLYDTIVVVDADERHSRPSISVVAPHVAGPEGVGAVVNSVALRTSAVTARSLATLDLVFSTVNTDNVVAPTTMGAITNTTSNSTRVKPPSARGPWLFFSNAPWRTTPRPKCATKDLRTLIMFSRYAVGRRLHVPRDAEHPR